MRLRAGVFAFVTTMGFASGAWATRPTPRELLDQAMAPVESQLTQIHATDAERRDVHDVTTRAEAIAARLVEVQHRGETDLATVLRRQLDLLGRIARARIDAQRLEGTATVAEREALDAEAHRVQARAGLERVAEQLLEFETAAHVAPVEAPASSVAPSAAPVSVVRPRGHR